MTRAEQLEHMIATAEPAELPNVAADLMRALSSAIARSAAAAAIRPLPTGRQPNRLLTIDQAAEKMRVSRDWLYRTKDLPFRRKVSPNALRFDEAGIDRWLAARGT